MQEHISGIYIIENILNGKVYIGASVHIERRIKDHKCRLRGDRHPNKHLQCAWDKYGESAFEFHIIEYSPIENLTESEQYWLDKLKHETEVYNQSMNVETSFKGCTHTEETRQKMRIAKLGKKRGPHSASTKRKISTAHMGKKLTAEHKAKMSKIQLGKKLTAEHKRNISLGGQGRGAILDKGKVKAIRRKQQQGERLADLAREYGVNKSTIGDIIHHRTWRWVE